MNAHSGWGICITLHGVLSGHKNSNWIDALLSLHKRRDQNQSKYD